MPHSIFQELINPDNQLMTVLHAHWIALTEIMSFITQQEHEVRRKQPEIANHHIDPGFIRWLKFLNAGVDYEHQTYNQWPMWVDEQLDKDITFFGKGKS